MPVSRIEIHELTNGPSRKLRESQVSAYIDKPACEASRPLSEMRIRCELLEDFEITVKNPNGGPVRCRDVFEQLYEWFDNLANISDRRKWGSNGRIEACVDALNKRCEASMRSVSLAEKKKGMRRVDLLQGKHFYKGLTRPADPTAKYWVVDFGDSRS